MDKKWYAYNVTTGTLRVVSSTGDLFDEMDYLGSDDTDAEDIQIIEADHNITKKEAKDFFFGEKPVKGLTAIGYTYSERRPQGMIAALKDLRYDRSFSF